MMSTRDDCLETPRRSSSCSSSSSSSRKRSRPGKDSHDGDTKRQKDNQEKCNSLRGVDVSPTPVAGPSHVVNSGTAVCSSKDEQLDHMTALLSGIFEKLDRSSDASVPKEGSADFMGFHDVSASDEELGEHPDSVPDPQSVPDPLEELDKLDCAQLTQHDYVDNNNAEFLRALEELSGHFHGEEEKGEPLSEHLATILNASLRRWPTFEGVKLTCSKIKLPSNVPNMTVPTTNPAISKAMSVGGKLIDARLSHTNTLLTKTLVPVAQCISDIGERKGKLVNHYLEGLNNSLRLLTSAVNYVNHLRKEVARIHVHDSALAELCKWDCEIGRDDLFPFDVAKKCGEIHKTKKLGRPTFRPYKMAGPRRYVPSRQPSKRPYFHHQSRPRYATRPFLGLKPQGKGAQSQRTPQ